MKIKLLMPLIVIFCSVFASPLQAQNNDLEIFAGYSIQRVETERFGEFTRYAGLTPAQVQTNFNATEAELNAGFKDTYRAARNLNGFNASITYYFQGSLGITGDFAYHHADRSRNTFNNPIFFEDFTRSRRRSLSLLAGPQYKFHKNSNIQPFVRALAGITRQKNRSSQFFNSLGGTNPGGTNQPIETTRLEDDFTTFTAGVGGGLDVKIHKNISIRVIQADYLVTFTRSREAGFTAPSIGGGSGVSLGQTSFGNSRRDNLRFSFGVVFRK
jgi:opacity protein-like surface antigen